MGQKGVKFSQSHKKKDGPLTLDDPVTHNDYERAAAAILDADFLIVGAGAGFSADAGLAVYKDIANFEAYSKMGVDYADLCQMDWLAKDPEIFYGFWGKCYNDYKDTVPHQGYKILLDWRNKIFQEAEYPVDNKESKRKLRRMHIYTSNVDRMFHKAGFSLDEIEEIHGNAVVMQCSEPCGEHVWELPPDFRYHVPEETMKAPNAHIVEGKYPNHPTCGQCGKPARPNVLMFGDVDYFQAPPPNTEYSYELFEDNMVAALNSKPGAKLVILEMGAGKRVPSIRIHCQRFLNSNAFPKNSVTLIRINPDFPDLDSLVYKPGMEQRTEPWFEFISFKAGALATLQKIHEAVEKLARSAEILPDKGLTADE